MNPKKMRIKGRWSKRLFLWVGLAFLYQDVFSGVSRYIFSSAGAAVVNYLPAIMLNFLCIAYMVTQAVTHSRMRYAAILAVISIELFYSLAVGRSIFAVSFAFYTWGAFFFGIIAVDRNYTQAILRHVPILWICAVIGVLINTRISFPWSGGLYEIAGTQVEVARDWGSFGVQRLPGFSRGSFAAANQILMCMVVLLPLPINRLVRLGIWIMSVVAIWFTTSKTPLIGAVVIPVFVYILALLCKARLTNSLITSVYIGTTLVLGLVVVVALPLVITIVGVGNTVIDLPFGLGLFRLDSLLDRVTYMWPTAFNLITADQAHPLAYFFGRGIGGIGAGQVIDEIYLGNTADNMFVFLYVTFGVFSFGLLALLASGWWHRLRRVSVQLQSYYGMALAVLVLGTLTNLIESVMPLFAFGAIAALTLFRHEGVPLKSRATKTQQISTTPIPRLSPASFAVKP